MEEGADEYVERYSADGLPTGERLPKKLAHLEGLWHATVHLWCLDAEGKGVYLQRRADDKDTHPGLWDVSVAGHVAFGESVEMAAVREAREEIGLEVPAAELKRLMVRSREEKHPNGIHDREHQTVFAYRLTDPGFLPKLQASEVAEIRIASLSFLMDWARNRPSDHVDQDGEYLRAVAGALAALR